MIALKPRQNVPALTLNTLQGEWSLQEQTPEHFTLVVFYRGLHCPVCKTYMTELQKLIGEFDARGVNVFVASSDTRERAQTAQEEWGLPDLTIGYDLPVATAQAWGLHRSASRGKTSIGIEEPAEFSEPGVFLIKPDHTLYWANISTMPFARPHFREILGAIDFALKVDYPARGELV